MSNSFYQGSSVDAAAFELTMQDPPRMNERLDQFDQLVGETILGAFESASEEGHWVLVTENRNWIVLKADGGYSCDESPAIEVERDLYGRARLLSDYVPARDLLNAGVINPGVFAELKAKEDAAAEVERQRKANNLRRQLADLERPA